MQMVTIIKTFSTIFGNTLIGNTHLKCKFSLREKLCSFHALEDTTVTEQLSKNIYF